MSAIPEDIMREARELFDGYSMETVMVAARAILAERERCAQIAEAPRCNTCGAVRQPNSDDDCCPWPDLETSSRDDIAAVIRSPERTGD